MTASAEFRIAEAILPSAARALEITAPCPSLQRIGVRRKHTSTPSFYIVIPSIQL